MNFWDVVVVTASSERQAESYRNEIQRRSSTDKLPKQTQFLAISDPDGAKIGSGGATVNALGVLGKYQEWWNCHRVLLIHSGGDSRRIPHFSSVGKLFGTLPSRNQSKATTTVFDELFALSLEWAERMPNGLLVASGDVVLRFNASHVRWDRSGATGIAMRLDLEKSRSFGVYVVGTEDQVYTFLQKPTPAEVKDAGGVLEDGRVAVDTGLIRMDADLASALTGLARVKPLPAVDLYDQIMRGLTGQWKPENDAGSFWRELSSILRGREEGWEFHCSVVDGEFFHVGTTRSFRELAAGTEGIIDSAIGGECKIGPEAVVLECVISGDVLVGRGAILHGLTGLEGPIEVPDDTVIHQIPVEVNGGSWVICAYGVEDDPKQTASNATWFNLPILETLDRLGLCSEDIWGAEEENTLWYAHLFPVTTPAEAWDCARWMMGYSSKYSLERWRGTPRLSFDESARCADRKKLADGRNDRFREIWKKTVIKLALSGADLRPILLNLPGLEPAVAVGHSLWKLATELRNGSPKNLTQAASYLIQASHLLDCTGFEKEAGLAESEAFTCIQDAVREGTAGFEELVPSRWRFDHVQVSAPSRIDLGGGWSDTPPFCLDWGGTVLNCALEVNGKYPIETNIRRIDEPVIRCFVTNHGAIAEYRSAEELLEPCGPGSIYSIQRAALQLCGIPVKGQHLRDTLANLGGGLEIRCQVDLPVGSGLGTSSILAATLTSALAAMSGRTLDDYALSDAVMHVEQRMTTGGGWQDQAGAIFPGAKLLMTGPGLKQRIRVQPVAWSERRQTEFCENLVLYNTGIQRVAKDLLRQVVSRYLARETATVQVLHSIKTLAVEMSYVMAEGDWKHLGELLDRHWQLNQQLDSYTTNATINRILDRARPYIHGAKLAGAGGGGFLMLLTRGPEAANEMRAVLSKDALVREAFVPYRIAEKGMHIRSG